MLDLQAMIMDRINRGVLQSSLVIVILLSFFSSEVEGGLTSGYGQHLLPDATESSAQENDPLPDPDTFLSAFLAKFSETAVGSGAGEDEQEDEGDLFQFSFPQIEDNPVLTTVNNLDSGPEPLQVEDIRQDKAQERSLAEGVGLLQFVLPILTTLLQPLGTLMGFLVTKKGMLLSMILMLLTGIGGALLGDANLLKQEVARFGLTVGGEDAASMPIDNRVDNEDALLPNGDKSGGLVTSAMLVFGNYYGEVLNQLGFSGNRKNKNHSNHSDTVGTSSNNNKTGQQSNTTQLHNLIGGVKMNNSIGYRPILFNNSLNKGTTHSPLSSPDTLNTNLGEGNPIMNVSENISVNNVLQLFPVLHNISDEALLHFHNHSEQHPNTTNSQMNMNNTVDSPDLHAKKTEETKEVYGEDWESLLNLILNKLKALVGNSTAPDASDAIHNTLETLAVEALLTTEEFSHNHTHDHTHTDEFSHNHTYNYTHTNDFSHNTNNYTHTNDFSHNHTHIHVNDNINITTLIGNIFEKLNYSQNSSESQSLDAIDKNLGGLSSSEHPSADKSQQSDIDPAASKSENPTDTKAEAVISIPGEFPIDDDEGS